jgi:hypothetical protein
MHRFEHAERSTSSNRSALSALIHRSIGPFNSVHSKYTTSLCAIICTISKPSAHCADDIPSD